MQIRKPARWRNFCSARIRFETNDFQSAAAILNSDVFKQKTKLGDYALWLRGRALAAAGNHAEAMQVFAQVAGEFPGSLRANESKMLWANSALQSGQAAQIPNFLSDLNTKHNADSLLLTAKSYEQQTDQTNAINFYRKVYFFGAGTDAAKEAEAKLTSLSQPLSPQTAEEIRARADKFYAAKNYAEASNAYNTLAINFPIRRFDRTQSEKTDRRREREKNARRFDAFNAIPQSANEKPEAYYQLAIGYAKVAAMGTGAFDRCGDARKISEKRLDTENSRSGRRSGGRCEKQRGRKLFFAVRIRCLSAGNRSRAGAI